MGGWDWQEEMGQKLNRNNAGKAEIAKGWDRLTSGGAEEDKKGGIGLAIRRTKLSYGPGKG